MIFKEALKNDLMRITPAPELLSRVSEIMREEAEKPRVSPLKMTVRFAGMAAAVTILAFGTLYVSGGISTGAPNVLDTTANNAGEIMPMNDSAEIADEDGIMYFAETAPVTTTFPRAQYDRDSGSAPAAEFAKAGSQDNASDEMQGEKGTSGGDEKASYYSLFDWKLAAIEGGLIEIVGEEAFEEWRIGKESFGCTTDPSENMNLYALILDFPQHKAAMEARMYEVLEIDRANGWRTHFTEEEEIKLLMNGEKDEICAYFVSPAAVYQDGKIYSPEWLNTHTVADYEAENLPKDQLREKLDEILWLSNVMDLTSLTEKLSEYLGETVTVPDRIEPVQTEEMIVEAIPEDVPEEGEEVPEEVISGE